MKTDKVIKVLAYLILPFVLSLFVLIILTWAQMGWLAVILAGAVFCVCLAIEVD